MIRSIYSRIDPACGTTVAPGDEAALIEHQGSRFQSQGSKGRLLHRPHAPRGPTGRPWRLSEVQHGARFCQRVSPETWRV